MKTEEQSAHILSKPPKLKIEFRPRYIPKLLPCTWLKEDYFYFQGQKAYLVLTTSSDNSWQAPPVWTEPNKWVKLFHQTGGHACTHHQMYARFLKPKKEIEPLFDLLMELYNDSCLYSPPSLEVATGYETLLKEFGLSANSSYSELEEGFYPLDIDCLSKVTSEKFPKDLNKLVKAPEKGEKKFSFLNWRFFNLAILGPNCD